MIEDTSKTCGALGIIEQLNVPVPMHDDVASQGLHESGRLRQSFMKLVSEMKLLAAAFISRGICNELLERCAPHRALGGDASIWAAIGADRLLLVRG